MLPADASAHFPVGVAPAALITLAAAWAYGVAAGFAWIWDDNLTILDNPLLRSGAGLGRIWTGIGTPDYFPLTSTVQWLQWHLWGVQPSGYHIDKCRFASGRAPGLFWPAFGPFRSGFGLGWGSPARGLHPLMVESVVWVSELEEHASRCRFVLLALLYYVVRTAAGARAAAPRPPSAASSRSRSWPRARSSWCPASCFFTAWWRRGRLEPTRPGGERPVLRPVARVRAGHGVVPAPPRHAGGNPPLGRSAVAWPPRERPRSSI